jgi:rod shape-determining protein MreC
MAAPADVIPRRPTLLLIVVLSLLFVLMSFSSRTRYVGETRTLFERTVMTVLSPVPRAVHWVGSGTSEMYHGYLDMRRAVVENDQLHRQVADLTADNLKLRQSDADLRRLRSLLAYADQIDLQTSMAQVIMLDTSGTFKSVIIDRGSASGVEINDTIVNASGLIGRVVLTTKDMAKVQLMIDSNCSVGALIERTRRQGVVRGDANTGAQMYDVPSLADVQPGDRVLTAGIDGIFPRGIPVGTIVQAQRGQDLFKQITVHPTVDFGNIEEVIVIHTRKIPPDIVRYAP